MRKLIIILFLSLIGLSITLPFIFFKSSNEIFQVSTNLLSNVAALGTLLIAYLLFDKFGISKRTVDKQVELVEQLVTKLRTLRIIGTGEKSGYFISPSKDLSHFKKFDNSYLVFSPENYLNGFNEILALGKNLYMPKELVKKINKFQISVLTPVKKEEIKDYVKIYFPPLDKEENEKENNWGIIDDEKVTLANFVADLEDILATSEKWFNKHSNHKIELNI